MISGKIAKKYIDNNMKIIIEDFSLPISKPWKIFSRKKKIIKIVKEEKPDIIHMHFVTNVLMLRFALRKVCIPRLFQVPGPLHLENKFFRKIEILLSNKFDYWAPSCKKSMNIYLKEGISSEKVFLSYYGGYGGETVETYEKSTNILHNELELKENDILVGMVSYFYKPKIYLGQRRGIKGHEDFIDAISILAEKYQNIKGIIIGGAWGNSTKYEKRVKEYSKKVCPKNVFFTGHREDLKKIYKELDIVVHPSHSENLGGAAESLAAGVPTIATNIGGFPDIIIDGKTGYLCECKNPVDISRKIEEMIIDKERAKNFAVNGQKLVKELLDINKTTHSMIEIYKKIMNIKGEE